MDIEQTYLSVSENQIIFSKIRKSENQEIDVLSIIMTIIVVFDHNKYPYLDSTVSY